jgi:hypothetical protein
MIESRLPEPARRRFQQRARARSASIGLVVVVAVGIGVASWVGQFIYIDVMRITGVPASLGFTMWSGHPTRGHPGAYAPSRVEALNGELERQAAPSPPRAP